MIVRPTLETLLAHRGPESHAVLSTSLLVDGDTPIAAFQKLAGNRPGSFLLESVEGGELMGRYSFLGFGIRDGFHFSDGKGTVTHRGALSEVEFDDPLRVLESELASIRMLADPELPRFQGGAVGYLGFDCVRYFEGIPLPDSPGLGLPEGILLFPDELMIFDHLRHRLTFVVHMKMDGDRESAYQHGCDRLLQLVDHYSGAVLSAEDAWDADLQPALNQSATHNRDDANLAAAIEQAREAIVEGEVFQVVLSRRTTVDCKLDPFDLYRALRALNPSPYMFFFRFDEFSVVGASPEVLVRLEDGEVLVRPIAGTRPRGDTQEQDRALEQELLADEKELAEHRMLVDLARNDVGRVARVGSVSVQDPLRIERYSHVMHIVTDVHGRLRDDCSAFDVFRACFPAGTVSGAPKIRAMELIARLEPDRRGPYAGAVGYFDFNGNMDTCIAIRTLVAESERVHIQAGAGIVFDSVAERELEECGNKSIVGLAAIARAMTRREKP